MEYLICTSHEFQEVETIKFGKYITEGQALEGQIYNILTKNPSLSSANAECEGYYSEKWRQKLFACNLGLSVLQVPNFARFRRHPQKILYQFAHSHCYITRHSPHPLGCGLITCGLITDLNIMLHIFDSIHCCFSLINRIGLVVCVW